MRASLRILMALALLAGTGVTGDLLLAACNDGLTQIYEVEQCAPARTWFAPPPPGSGPVSAAWWQIGFGNLNLNVGGTNNGSGWRTIPAAFIGNDSGTNTGDPANLDIQPAEQFGGPAGSLCVGGTGSANWARPGIDGCADNPRSGASALGNTSKKDLHINAYYYSHPANGGAGIGYYTLAYQIDAPMAVLLTEGSGKAFALGMFASKPRPSPKERDASPGGFDLGFINNGDPNPAGPNNVIPWQPIPSPSISASFTDPGNPSTSPRMLAMSWGDIRLVHDGSVRPSADTTMPVSGVGVMDQGTLRRFAVETAPILDAAGTCGTFAADPPITTLSTTKTVNPDTCVRLRTILGRTPSGSTNNLQNSAEGRLGDLGTSVVSNAVLIGGTLVSNQIVIDSASKKGAEITIRFHTGAELGTPTYSVHGVGGGGKDLTLSSVPCSSCNSGVGSSYTVTVSGKGGVKSVFIVSSSGEKSNTVDVR